MFSTLASVVVRDLYRLCLVFLNFSYVVIMNFKHGFQLFTQQHLWRTISLKNNLFVQIEPAIVKAENFRNQVFTKVCEVYFASMEEVTRSLKTSREAQNITRSPKTLFFTFYLFFSEFCLRFNKIKLISW